MENLKRHNFKAVNFEPWEPPAAKHHIAGNWPANGTRRYTERKLAEILAQEQAEIRTRGNNRDAVAGVRDTVYGGFRHVQGGF